MDVEKEDTDEGDMGGGEREAVTVFSHCRLCQIKIQTQTFFILFLEWVRYLEVSSLS